MTVVSELARRSREIHVNSLSYKGAAIIELVFR